MAIRAYDESAKQGADMWGEQIPKKNVEQILQEQGYEPRTTQGVGNAVRPELVSGARRGEADGRAGQAEVGGDQGAAQASQPEYSYNRDFLRSSLFQKAKHYDPNQLLIQINDQPLRPGEDTEQTRVDRAGLAASVLVRGHRGSLLGLAIATDWITGKGSSLLGKRVTSPADLATLGAVLRDPRAETFRYFLVKEGKVVYHTVVSSRMAGSTSTVIGDPDEFLAGINEAMKRLGADGYYLMHNHSSRLVKASTAQPTTQQKAKGRRTISPVLLPLTTGDGR